MASEIKAYDFKETYSRIILLGMTAHFPYIFLFIVFSIPSLAIYNTFSVLFYIVMFLLTQKRCFRLVITCIHIEVCIFAIISTLEAGWDTGISLYLIAMTSLTYFCPFRHTSIPYVFAGLDVIVFLLLKLYCAQVAPDFLAVSDTMGLWLYIYNACACFAVMLYSAFSFKLSAIVNQRMLKEENQSLNHLASYDQLTGLLSRHAFLTRLEHAKQDTLVLALGDIDDFKQVNDTWGHECGDVVLRETAELLRRGLHAYEVDICRWGGEEFVLLFYQESCEHVMEIMHEMALQIKEYDFFYQGNLIHITMTFGVSEKATSMDAKELIDLADQCMYEGKNNGKDCVVCVDEKSGKGSI